MKMQGLQAQGILFC